MDRWEQLAAKLEAGRDGDIRATPDTLDIIARAANEPYDLARTAQDIYGDPHDWKNYVGLLPLVPGGMVKKVAKVGKAVSKPLNKGAQAAFDLAQRRRAAAALEVPNSSILSKSDMLEEMPKRVAEAKINKAAANAKKAKAADRANAAENARLDATEANVVAPANAKASAAPQSSRWFNETFNKFVQDNMKAIKQTGAKNKRGEPIVLLPDGRRMVRVDNPNTTFPKNYSSRKVNGVEWQRMEVDTPKGRVTVAVEVPTNTVKRTTQQIQAANKPVAKAAEATQLDKMVSQADDAEEGFLKNVVENDHVSEPTQLDKLMAKAAESPAERVADEVADAVTPPKVGNIDPPSMGSGSPVTSSPSKPGLTSRAWGAVKRNPKKAIAAGVGAGVVADKAYQEYEYNKHAPRIEKWNALLKKLDEDINNARDDEY